MDTSSPSSSNNNAASSNYGNFYAKSNKVSTYWSKKYEKEANKFWNQFYKSNKTNFFKDRHWLLREFPCLAPQHIHHTNDLTHSPSSSTPTPSSTPMTTTVFEIGCGVGNTVFPLIEENPYLFAYACDFSQKAIELMQASPHFIPDRIKAFVCDVTSQPLPDFIQDSSVDCVTLIFVLSAMSLDKMKIVVPKIHKVLKKGGRVLIRDYAKGDMAQLRFEQEEPNKEPNKLEENFYVRGDGTRAYYFTKDTLADLFTPHGFTIEQNEYIQKVVTNVKESKEMHRIWIQFVAVKE